MKTRMYLQVLIASVALVATGAAAERKGAEKKARPPADVDAQEFYKARDAALAKPEQAQLDKMVERGLSWIEKYATDTRAPMVARDLAAFSVDVKEKTVRGPYNAQLNYQIVSRKFKEGITPEVKAAIAALDTARVDSETRLQFTRPALQALREKIDEMATIPGIDNYLVAAEESYFDLVSRGINDAAGEKHLRSLLESPNKAVAKWAQASIGVFELKKSPLALTFTSLEGKQVDSAQYRGKALAVVFWSAADESSRKEIQALSKVLSENKDRLNIILVSYDEAANRDALLKAVSDMKVAWPVQFEGTGAEHTLGKKLAVKNVPSIALFDTQGLLVNAGLKSNQVSPAVQRIFEPKSAKKK